MGKSNFVVEAGKNPKMSTPRTEWSNNRFYDWVKLTILKFYTN